jgi:hypothetical protein
MSVMVKPTTAIWFAPMAQSRRGVTQILEVHLPLVVVMLRFIQLGKPLPPLKPMAQSQRGAPCLLEALYPPLILRILQVQVALSILKPAGSVGATVQLTIAPAADGSITVWGNSNRGGADAPAGSGYTRIYSTGGAFAALKTDGSIAAWGDSNKSWYSHYQRGLFPQHLGRPTPRLSHQF